VNKVSIRRWLAEAWRFTLHILTGLLAVAAHYTLMAILLHFGSKALVATTIGTAAGALTRFVLSYLHVFEPTRGAKVALGRFLVVLGMQTVANGAMFSAFLGLGLTTWPAQIATTILLTFANYAMYRLWVFR
jgi:putative flippase GtrA